MKCKITNLIHKYSYGFLKLFGNEKFIPQRLNKQIRVWVLGTLLICLLLPKKKKINSWFDSL